MIDAAVLDALLQAGASAEMIAAVVKAALASQEAKDEDRRARARSGNAERQRRHRERNANNAVTARDEPLSTVTSRDENVPKIEVSRAPICAGGLSGEEVISKIPLTVTTLPVPKTEKQAKPAKPSPKSELVEAVGDELAAEVVDHRQRMRKPLTPQAASRLAKQFLDTGRPQDAARMMIDRGWQGFNADWFANAAPRAGPNGSHPADTRERPLTKFEQMAQDLIYGKNRSLFDGEDRNGSEKVIDGSFSVLSERAG